MMEFVMMKSTYQSYTLIRQDRSSHQKRGGVILYVKSNLLPQRVLHPPTTPSSLYVSLIACELLFNTEPSIIALVYRSPNTPPPDNISLICTLETIISRRPDRVVLGDFNRPKVNWVSNAASPNTVNSQLLDFCSDSLLFLTALVDSVFLLHMT